MKEIDYEKLAEVIRHAWFAARPPGRCSADAARAAVAGLRSQGFTITVTITAPSPLAWAQRDDTEDA